MEKFVMVIMLVVLMCFCGGCETYYYQSNLPIEQCKKDRENCVDELKKYSTFQEIGDYELKFMEDCMVQKGYLLVTEDKLPTKVRREEPDTSLHWKLHGVAGTVE